jgi:hypothetical protein
MTNFSFLPTCEVKSGSLTYKECHIHTAVRNNMLHLTRDLYRQVRNLANTLFLSSLNKPLSHIHLYSLTLSHPLSLTHSFTLSLTVSPILSLVVLQVEVFEMDKVEEVHG